MVFEWFKKNKEEKSSQENTEVKKDEIMPEKENFNDEENKKKPE